MNFIPLSIKSLNIKKVKKDKRGLTMSERPIDALDKAKGKKVFIKLKNGEEITGSLRALDLHLNLWIEDADIESKEYKKKFSILLIRGDNILYASPV